MLSVVTPTYRRPQEIVELLDNLRLQKLQPDEVIIVDGAPADERATEENVARAAGTLPFPVRYVRSDRGTAIQRNAGIDLARGELVALLDDDVRLEPDFWERIAAVFREDAERRIGGIVGYRTNRHFQPADARRWQWYRRLRLLTIFEPGRYDRETGYPINSNLQPPFEGTREIDFMTTACAVWRREVFDAGLRFDPFFRDYGVLEDAHFALRAGRRWRLLQCGDAHCIELHSPHGRTDSRKIGYKCVVNYYFVFRDIAGPLRPRQQWRFWRYQAFELFRIAASALRRRRRADVQEILGRLEGTVAIIRGKV
ncbi:MAG: glycosyltransferase family 2 protein [Blastocatellia bacterium]|nr:glycosyltransferase family 2 protein [Blastocatellia bacterium]